MHTIYKYVLNFVVKISVMFAKYFQYYTIILRGPFLWTWSWCWPTRSHSAWRWANYRSDATRWWNLPVEMERTWLRRGVRRHHLPLTALSVPNICGFTDMTSCEHFSCVYIGDYDVECVHRLDVQGAATRWAVNDKPACLSVNAARNVILTCPNVLNIKEFSSHVI